MLSRLRKRARMSNEPSTNWFDIPAEMREMVIDRMDYKTRCKFAKCSKICEKEAKMSRNYLKMIKISRKANPELQIGHQKYANYCLEFIDVGDLSEARSIVVYKTKSNFDFSSLKWMKIEEGNAEDVRLRYLSDYIEKYKKAITDFEICDNDFPFDKFDIKNLKNLEHIEIQVNTVVLIKGFINVSQILRCFCVYLKNTKMPFDEILQFRGVELTISSDEFSEENIAKYLKMWKNGELSRVMKSLNVNTSLKLITLDWPKIIRGLEVYNYKKEHDLCTFRFRLNYQRKDKCFTLFYCWSDSISIQIMSSRLRKRPRLVKPAIEPTSSWFDLPSGVRELVIDQMDSKTRCRYAQCSKLCEKEAKASEKYLKMLKVGRKKHAELLIGHGTKCYDYCLEFVKIINLTDIESIVLYKTANDENNVSPRVIKWSEVKPGRAKNARIKYLNDFLKKYKLAITRIEIDDEKLDQDMLNLKELKNLEYIDVKCDEVLKNELLDLEQILRADHVCLINTNLSFRNILKFEGSALTIKSDGFIEYNIKQYLQMWKNGKLGKNMRYLDVKNEKKRKFSGQGIIKNLDAFDYEENDDECSFRFCLQYPNDENCFCEVTCSPVKFTIRLETDSYDEVMKNRKY